MREQAGTDVQRFSMVGLEVMLSSSERGRSNTSRVLGRGNKGSICYFQVNGSGLVSERVEGTERVIGKVFAF